MVTPPAAHEISTLILSLEGNFDLQLEILDWYNWHRDRQFKELKAGAFEAVLKYCNKHVSGDVTPNSLIPVESTTSPENVPYTEQRLEEVDSACRKWGLEEDMIPW